MSYCEKFESVVRQMIFKEETVPKVLYKALYDFYLKEDEDARTKEVYTEDANNKIKDIQEKIKEKKITIDLRQDITPLIPQFIKDFAKYFHSITFLNEALEDAPPVIKEQKLPLTMEVLSQLDSKEAQEKELSSLSSSAIRQMIVGAKDAYEENKENVKLAERYQQLAHMCVWEMVARRLSDLSTKETPASKVEFLQSLQADLPEVGTSDIFDTLSQYRNSAYETFKEFIQTNLQDEDDLAFQEAERGLFNKLRFGQKELREYLTVRQSKLAMSLFWARDIRDDSLAKGTLAANLFREMAEKQALKISGKVGDLPPTPGFTYLAEILQVAKTRYKKTLEDTNNPNGATTAVESFLTEKIINPTPYYTLSKEQIKVAFPTIQFIDESGAKGHHLLTEITSKMGRNWSSREFNARILSTNLRGQAVDSVIFTGNSLDEIEQQIKQISEEAKRASFLAGLEGIRRNLEKPVIPVVSMKAERKSVVPSKRSAASAVKAETVSSSFEKPLVFEISQLGLSDSNERMLRQLLELHFVYKKLPEEAKSYSSLERFRPLFKKIEAGVFTDFKIEEIEELSAEEKQQGLNALVETQYQNLASFAQIEDSRAQQILSNARALQESRTERQEQTRVLHAILETPTESALASGIEHVFIEEYQKMLPVLKVSNDLLRRDLKDMAKDTAKLLVRMKKGEPILSQEETAGYYRVVENLMEHLKRENLSLENVSLKVKHSNGNSQKVVIYDLNGKELTSVSIHASLPYSLIKAPGQSDFVFSLGGKRGVEAPFEGLENPNTRYFTASRLAGVGQYGTVKAVVALKTSDMRVVKKGVLEEGAKTKDSARKSPLLRGMTSRADPRLPKIESLILQEISSQNQYWESEGKEKQAGLLYENAGRSREFRILMDRVAGQSYADFAVARFTPYDKSSFAYHNPVATEHFNEALEDTLDLAKAIVEEASHLEKRGFIHNDIKPENFHFLKTQAGYEVHFLDWATGGFEATYEGSETDLRVIFQQKFNVDLEEKDGQVIGKDEPGFFVKKDVEGRIRYGINPSLEITHGARHGTLPYISPELAKGPSSENVELSANDSRMDDWALTAMLFGICNQEAYFNIVKGRVVLDYVIPGILEVDSEDANALKIENQEKFDDYFKVDDEVMFIPGNKREGEPLHLYRRLMHLQKQVTDDELAGQINELLTEVKETVAAGKGLSKEALEKSVAKAKRYFQEYEKSLDLKQQEHQKADNWAQEIIDEYQGPIEPNLLLGDSHGKSKFTRLIESSLAGVEETWSRINFTYDNFSKMAIKGAVEGEKFVLPGRYLLVECIGEKREDLLITFLDKISKTVEAPFFDFVEEQGLIHYALEQGLTSASQKLMETLERCKEKDKIFDLLIKSYTAEEKTFLNWSMDTLHIATANQNIEQLEGILKYLPAGENYKEAILHALHFSASLGYEHFFNTIFEAYNRVNATSLTVSEVLNTEVNSEPSAYHQFLKYEKVANPFWEEHPSYELIKQFLLKSSGNEYALVIAASHENYQAVHQLYNLVAENEFSKEEIKGFFTQEDQEGHNILFHLLQQKQSKQLAVFLNTLQEYPTLKEDILSTLVGSQSDLFDGLNQSPQLEDLGLLSQVLGALEFDEEFYAEQLLKLQKWFVGVPANKTIKEFLEKIPLSFELKESVLREFAKDERRKEFFTRLADDCQAERKSPRAITVNIGAETKESIVWVENPVPPLPIENVIDLKDAVFTPRDARSIPASLSDEDSFSEVDSREQDSLQGEDNSSIYSQRSTIEQLNEDLEQDLDYIASLKEEIVKLQQQVGTFKAESENAKMFEKQTILELQTQIEQLNTELASVKESAQENISKIHELEKEREADAKVQSAEALRAQAKAEESVRVAELARDSALNQVSNLQGYLNALQSKLDTDVNENEHLKKEIARLQAELTTAQENLTRTESTLENKTLALQRAEDNAQKAEKESAVSRANVEAAKSAQTQAEESKVALERENEQLKTLIGHSQEKSTFVESEIERLQKELEQTLQIVKDLEYSQSQAEARASRAEDESTNANARVEVAVAAATAIKKEKDTLLADLNVVKTEVSRLEAASQAANSKAEVAEASRAEAEAERGLALESLNVAERERKEVSDAVTALQNELKTLNDATGTHQQEISDLRSEIELLQEKLKTADDLRQNAVQLLEKAEEKLKAAEAFSATSDASSKVASAALEQAEIRFTTLQHEMTTLNLALGEANAQLAKAHEEKSTAQAEIERLKEAFKASEHKAREAELNESRARHLITNIQDKAARDVEASRIMAEAAHSRSDSMHSKISDLEVKVFELGRELRNLQDEKAILHAHLTVSKKENFILIQKHKQEKAIDQIIKDEQKAREEIIKGFSRQLSGLSSKLAREESESLHLDLQKIKKDLEEALKEKEDALTCKQVAEKQAVVALAEAEEKVSLLKDSLLKESSLIQKQLRKDLDVANFSYGVEKKEKETIKEVYKTKINELIQQVDAAQEKVTSAEQQARLAHEEKEQAIAEAASIKKEAETEIANIQEITMGQLKEAHALKAMSEARAVIAEARVVTAEEQVIAANARALTADAQFLEANAALNDANANLAFAKEQAHLMKEKSLAAESIIKDLQAELETTKKEVFDLNGYLTAVQRLTENAFDEMSSRSKESLLNFSSSLEEANQKWLGAEALYQALQVKHSQSQEELIRKQREFSTALQVAKANTSLIETQLSVATEEAKRARLNLHTVQMAMQGAENKIARLEEELNFSQNQRIGLEKDKHSLENEIGALKTGLDHAIQVVALVKAKEEKARKEVNALENTLLNKQAEYQATRTSLEDLETRNRAYMKAVSSRSTDLRKSLAQARNTHRNLDSNEPSLVRVSGHITRSLPSMSSVEEKSGFIIYADLKKDGDVSTLSHQSSFNEEGVIQISPNEGVDLTNEEHQQLFSDGLEVTSSSGYDFHLQANSQEYVAELKASAVSDSEEDQELQNIAVAVKEMIDNIVSKCSEVEIISDNAFIHTFANAYIKYLKTEEGLAIKPVNTKVYDTEDTLKAKDVFEKLKPQFSKSSVCYHEAKSRVSKWGRNSLFSSQTSESSQQEGSFSLTRK